MSELKKVLCINCQKPIYRRVGWVNESLKLGHNFYCSKKCESQYKSKEKLLVCENCGKTFLRIPSEISLHNYCSQSCAATANNRKYPKARNPKLQTCLRCGKQFRKSKGNLKYCSVKCRRNTPQQLIDIIKQAARELKRIPAKRELREIDSSCVRTFGSWSNAIIAAGFQPNRSHSQRMYKRTKTQALDGHLCDSVSEALIDNWLTENNISHERDIPYPGTNHKADWAVFLGGSEIFVEYFGLAKDSPRYDRTIEIKRTLCRKYGLNLVALYPQDLYPIKRLDNKLKNKFKDLIDF